MDILASVGPTLHTYQDIASAVENGSSYFRLPLGYDQDYIEIIQTIRKVEQDLKSTVKIALDLPASRPRFELENNIEVAEGTEIKLAPQRESKISHHERFINLLSTGTELYSHDGDIHYRVTQLADNQITLCCTKGSGLIKDGNSLSVLSDHPEYALVTDSESVFLRSLNELDLFIDCIIFSFSQDIETLELASNHCREILGYRPEIWAKIETKFGVYQAQSIATKVDGIMLGRGDLSSTVTADFLAFAQNELGLICTNANIKAILATNVFTGFSESGKISFSEVNSINLALRQQYSVFMLGKETVWSEFAVESIKQLRMVLENEQFKNQLTKITLNSRSKISGKQTFAIEGPNGCGKSTVVNMLCDYYQLPYNSGVPDCFLEGGLKYRMIADADWSSSCLYFLAGVAEKIRELKQNAQLPFSIIDRSLWSTLSAHTSEDPTRLKFIVDTLNKLDDTEFEPSFTIILRSSYAQCRERIITKNNQTEIALDKLVDSEAYYHREAIFYDWLTLRRSNVINIDVTGRESSEIYNEIIHIIDGILHCENTDQ